MPICDGCGAPADQAHIRGRIERLEFATRFRPIHIQVLLLDAAPLSRPEDYFYRPAARAEDRSADSRRFFDAIAKFTGQASGESSQEESTLVEFQKRGFFLAYAVECPVENPGDLTPVIRRLAPAVLLRLKFSYKPKFIAPISSALRELLPRFASEGWSDRLILNDGKPFDNPFSADARLRATIAAALSDHSHP
jgi:hypothetical protein